MQKSADELQKNNKSKASQSQQEASKQMKQLADKLKQKNEDAEDAQSNIDIDQLRQLLKNLINSSFQQENVMEAFKNTNTSDPNYITLSQKQKNIKDNLKTAEDSLYAISKKVPQIQSTVNKQISEINEHIEQALQNLGERHTPEATSNQQYAMTSMNNLALMLSEALEQLQNSKANGKSGKGKGKKQSISSLAKMQEQLNKNMQQARDQMQKQGNKGQSGQGQQGRGNNMSEQFAKFAREQEMIRQLLQQINQNENKDGTGKSGDLDKISKQMEQNERDLVHRAITDETLKRQQQIQTRLLEAEKADQEREQDQKRESNAGKDLPPGYIKALQDYQQMKAKQTEQIKTVSPAINLYYKQKINIYFDQINAN
jgi:hypothetical protein